MTDTTGMADDATEATDATRRADDATEMADATDMPDDAIQLNELLEYLAEGLVDDPEQVSVERFDEQDGTIVLELAVGPDDYGKIIGRGGRTAHALRTIVKAAAAHEGRRVLVDIVD
jgi:predicted RNA-binding protein YlqC (UPF0109 family)